MKNTHTAHTLRRIITLALTVILLTLALCACAKSADTRENPHTTTDSHRTEATAAPNPPRDEQSGMHQDDIYDGYEEPQTTGMVESDDAYPSPPFRESYLSIQENAARSTATDSLLTFSLKVDTASYANAQRYLENNQLPSADAVRVEEFINYFPYDTQMTFDTDPFAIYTEVGPSPFDANKRMAFVRVKTADIDRQALPASNLVFLIDTSGSMNSHDKLPLLQKAFAMLAETLDSRDRVSIVTYAGSAGVVLNGMPGDRTQDIVNAINDLRPGGSTAGAEGITLAYALAQEHFLQGGNNRVILATDGDFNVGLSDVDALSTFVSEKRQTGVYLSVLGFGTGNIRDDIMETLAKDGNGNYQYINNSDTAHKVLVDELAANLFVVAADVKAQVEFNPAHVKSYRLIGYENRQMANEDFTDDTKDAGEVGAGTDVVMMFELELAGESGLKYSEQAPVEAKAGRYGDELFEVRIRYKHPGETRSQEILHPVTVGRVTDSNSTDFRFAGAVAAFGQLLRGSAYTGTATYESVYQLAKEGLGSDWEGYRRGFLDIIKRAEDLE